MSEAPVHPARLAVGVIGAGKVGAVLGAALARAGHRVVAVSAVSQASQDRAADLLPGVPIRTVPEVVEAAELVLLAVPDDALADLAGGLSATGSWQAGQIVAHTSGRHGAAVLDPVRSHHAFPIAMHPAMTFTGSAIDLERLHECCFGVTADERILPIASALVLDMGAEPVTVAEDDRIAYHCALAHGSNHLVTLTSQAVLEEASGGRMHYMFNRVGGLYQDVPAGWLTRVSEAVSAVRTKMSDVESLLIGNPILQGRTRGVGTLSPELIHAYGVSGPIARASGVDVDLRRDAPYLAYAELFSEGGPGRVVTRSAGDSLARLEVLLEQVHVSLDLADACLDRLGSLPQGPVNQRLPKVLKVPEGEHYVATENPLGFNGYFLVSRGEKTPWRLKLRSASFSNIQVLREMLPGCLVSDMVSVLGSMFFVVGDVDK